MVVIGVVGRSGSGKTTVSRMFESLGAVRLDVDEVGRSVVEPGSAALAKVVSEFGPDYILPDGTLNRKDLGTLVFSDPAQLAKLNSVTHPAIFEQVRAWLGRAGAQCPQPPAAVIDAAVLFEAGLSRLVDYVVAVVAGHDVAVSRITERDGITSEAAAARLAAQIDPASIRDRCHFVVCTDGGLEDTYTQVRLAWDQMMDERGVK